MHLKNGRFYADSPEESWALSGLETDEDGGYNPSMVVALFQTVASDRSIFSYPGGSIQPLTSEDSGKNLDRYEILHLEAELIHRHLNK
ncbi:MAG: hypothetical protein ABI220_00860 [Candidatus Saccharimonadales bacterium]